ncbi:MAG: hypothetical protein ACFFDH_22690 [Promethearchaeota archaeon]
MPNLYNEKEKFNDAFVSYLINPYFHCENLVCIPVCPDNAFSKRESN